MNQNSNQGSAANKPLAKCGDVAVFLKRNVTVEDKEVPIYNIVEGKQGGPKQYCEAFGDVAGIRLSAEDVLGLYGFGKFPYVEGTFHARNGGREYQGAIVGAGIEDKPWSQGEKHGTNRTLQCAIVPYAIKDGKHYGYQVDNTLVFKTVGAKSAPVELNARDAFDLVKGGVGKQLSFENGDVVELKEIKTTESNGRTYKTARMGVTYGEQVEHPEHDSVEEEEGSGVKL